MRADQLTVYIIDDDPSVRDALALRLGIAGYRTALFSDAESFLAAVDSESAGCAVADLKLPGKSGLELQQALKAKGIGLPVVIITAQGDIASARSAFRAEAVDFLQKPFESAQLISAIDAAFESEERRLRGQEAAREHDRRIERLTPREREVLAHVANGLHAKEIAAKLGISTRTVEVHKASLMEKIGARNLAEVMRFALTRPGTSPPEPRS